jgi:phenylacetate-CoA ligase
MVAKDENSMNQSLDRQLRHFIQYAYDNAPAVEAIFDDANLVPADIQSVADLDKVPVITKDWLIELQQADPPFGGFLAVSPDRLQRLCLTPGPIYVPWAGEAAVTDTYRKSIATAGFQAGDVVMTTVAYHFNPVGLAVDEMLRDVGVTVIAAGVGNADLQIRMMLELGVTGYFGIPSWLMALIQKAEELGHDFKEFSLRKAHVAGEPLAPAVREAFVEKYGLRVTNAYAVAEVGVLAYNTEGGHAMHLFDSPIVQVVNPETGQSVGPGEVGEVVVTSFNETFPMIRLGTGDIAMNVDPAPGESRQEERSIILVGRIGDAVKVRGIFVHPNQLRYAVSQVPGIARVQGVITRPENRDGLTLRVVPAEESADRDELTAALTAAVRSVCRVRVDHVQFVPTDALGEKAETLVDERTWE